MTEAERLCKNVNIKIKPQAITLANAVIAMQEKIEEQIPVYKQMPLAQQVKVGTGEKIFRANPAVQEFRATIRDYATALNNLQNVLENSNEPAEVSNLNDLRAKFKVAK